MRFSHVRLQAPAGSEAALEDFYAGRLGLEGGVEIGETQLAFEGGSGQPFYHFALLVPGNRFDAALDWIGERTQLLLHPQTGEAIFDFANWDALACYFHDPVGNIVELIAHRGTGASSTEGPFTAAELLGISELGLVGDRAELATALHDELGLERWDGDLDHEASLAFVGEKARTFILSPEGRGWLPTGRPAEAHPCEVVLSGPSEGAVLLGASRYRIRAVTKLPGLDSNQQPSG